MFEEAIAVGKVMIIAYFEADNLAPLTRNRPLKLSTTVFCLGLAGAMEWYEAARLLAGWRQFASIPRNNRASIRRRQGNQFSGFARFCCSTAAYVTGYRSAGSGFRYLPWRVLNESEKVLISKLVTPTGRDYTSVYHHGARLIQIVSN